MSRYVTKVNGRSVYLCHGCLKPLRAQDLAEGRTTHWVEACRLKAIQKADVRLARAEGLPVKQWRAKRLAQGLR
jgi:hypothetical protein